jgi:hypothetical protein
LSTVRGRDALMLGSLIAQTGTALGRRAYVSAFLPAVLALGAIIGIVAVNRGLADSARSWDDQSNTVKAMEIAAFVASAAIVAGLIVDGSVGIMRLYEGGWGVLGRGIGMRAVRWHRKRLSVLAAEIEAGQTAVYAKIYSSYPLPTQPGEVMATQLGNVLKNAELYPRDRYNIDAVLAWPRLFPLLPEGFTALLTASRAALDRALATSVLAVGAGTASAAYTLVQDGHWQLFLACWWGGAALAWLMYRSALSAAAVYGQQIKTAFDLYRGILLTTAWPDGDESLDEWTKWGRLCAFWLSGVPLDTARPPEEIADAAEANTEPEHSAHPPAWLLALGVTILGIMGASYLGVR